MDSDSSKEGEVIEKDVARQVEEGAGGSIAGSIAGASMGGNITGSFAGAVVGGAAAREIVEEEAAEDEEAAPIDYEALDAFGSRQSPQRTS